MSEIAFRATERGFGRGEFKDLYGQECSVQDSSLATEPAIWLGVDRGLREPGSGGLVEMHARMHLGVDQAKCLIEVLQRFLRTESVLGADDE